MLAHHKKSCKLLYKFCIIESKNEDETTIHILAYLSENRFSGSRFDLIPKSKTAFLKTWFLKLAPKTSNVSVLYTHIWQIKHKRKVYACFTMFLIVPLHRAISWWTTAIKLLRGREGGSRTFSFIRQIALFYWGNPRWGYRESYKHKQKVGW